MIWIRHDGTTVLEVAISPDSPGDDYEAWPGGPIGEGWTRKGKGKWSPPADEGGQG